MTQEIQVKVGENMELIEFVEKFTKKENINLLPYQKEVIKQISQAIEEGKEIKICYLGGSTKLFYKDMLKAYREEIKEVKNDEN